MNQESLNEFLIRTGYLESSRVIKAFEKIDRADFVLPEYRDSTYGNFPLPINHGQTISQPATVAFMLELLQVEEGDRVLDVGSGSGWTTALLAEIVGNSGEVVGVEIVPELVEFGSDNLGKYRFSNARIIEAEEGGLGYQPGAPYDKILVSASANNISDQLINQLKTGGRLVIPVKNSIWKVDKVSDDKVKREEFPGFVFVPLKH
jgi:protein-L-isoaspartate(D-aspartate) O-methyltransferase